MNIYIKRSGFEGFHTDLFHILRLYYEKVELCDDTAEQAEAVLAIDVNVQEASGHIAIHACYTVLAHNTSWEKSHHIPQHLRSTADANKTLKRGILQCLLLLFTEITGLQQPWGTLTGIRPTKLMHQLLQQHARDDVAAILREDYLLHEEKIQLLLDIVDRQLKVLPDLYKLDQEVSIYIGIPFCPTKCAYCTFPAYDIRGNNGSVDSFLHGLHEEIRQTGRWLKEKGLKITTIYWGGGTPTSISALEMDALFRTMAEAFPSMENVRELTVEAGRPDTITADKIEVMKQWKVDRISINPQSFTDETLEAIGRHHSVEETLSTFKTSRELGMDNINMDLIIGLPGEGLTEFTHTLAETEKLMPESLTVHTLSFKRASAMTKQRDQYKVADRDEIRAMMQLAEQWTEVHAYKPYYLYRQKNILGNLENVGYALDGRESLYNILMMEERQTIIGLGCGAVSKIVYPSPGSEGLNQRIERFPNPKEPAAYNRAYQEYIDKKINLLEQAYGQYESIS